MSMRDIIDMVADRGAFICQSQSLNMFVAEANAGKLSSMHFYAWKKGLKTGMYYLRTKAARDAIQFTVKPVQENLAAVPVTAPMGEVQMLPISAISLQEQIACSITNPEACVSCGS